MLTERGEGNHTYKLSRVEDRERVYNVRTGSSGCGEARRTW